MGDPRRLRKKYSTPTHPWIKTRIGNEKTYITKYGFKNKKEIWKVLSLLSKLKREAKKIIALSNKELAEKETWILFNKLKKYNLVGENAKIEDVLAIQPEDIMERRLQTLVYKKGLAKTIKQARQMIVHRHIIVDKKIINSPSYIVTIDEETNISYAPRSKFSRPDHPEILKLKENKEKMDKESNTEKNNIEEEKQKEEIKKR